MPEEEQFPQQDGTTQQRTAGWQILWVPVHLAAIYTIVFFCAPWLAGWTHGRLLPLLGYPTTSSRFEFFHSHILAFSFLPAFIGGLASSKLEHKAAKFVWLPPAVILVYKCANFPVTSVFTSHFSAAFHQYFEGGFLIPEVRNWQDMRAMAGSSDVVRALAQLDFSAPFYAGVGYSAATWISLRTKLGQKLSERIEKWEESRFGEGTEDQDDDRQ
jgi:hypothetical protein